MRFQFSLGRLMLAIAGFAAILGLIKPLGPRSIPGVLIASSAVALIVLITAERHAWPIIRSLTTCVFGAFVGFIMCPMIRPPYESGDEFRYMMVGAIFGWLIGVVFGHGVISGRSTIPSEPLRPTSDERQSRAAPDQPGG